MKKTIVLYGATGYVGSYVEKILKEDFNILPIGRGKRIKMKSYAAQIAGFVNCAGYAGEITVDDCAENPDKLKESNVDLVNLIMDELNSLGKEVPLIHISTGCMFTNQFGSTEEERPNCLNVYTISKLNGEAIIQKHWKNSIILRPRLIFSNIVSWRNPLYKVSQYEKVITSQESATPLHEFAVNIKEFLNSLLQEPVSSPQVIHSVCSAPLRWMEIAQEMHNKGLRENAPYPMSVYDLLDNTVVKRSSVVLRKTKFRNIKLPFNAQDNALNLLDSLKANMSIQ